MSAEWGRSAACIGQPEEVFFPPVGGFFHAAKAICATCPVVSDCLAEALAEEEGFGLTHRSGVRGGLTPRERHAADPLRAAGGKRTHQPKDTCRRGHDLTTPENVYQRGEGGRQCAACKRLRRRGGTDQLPTPTLFDLEDVAS